LPGGLLAYIDDSARHAPHRRNWKMIKFGVSDSLVVPLALPGSLLCLGSMGIVLLANPSALTDGATAIDGWARGGAASNASHGAAIAGVLAVTVLLIYLASVFLGVVLAVIGGYFESWILDKLSPRRLGISQDDFDDQWRRYVDFLETEESKNSLASDFVDLFLFQLRSSVALLFLLILALGLAWRGDWPHSLLVTAGILALCLIPMLISAAHYHLVLGDFRKRRFGDSPVAARDALELVAKQISKWCSRESHQPLSILLPVWILDRKKDTLQKLSDALAKTAELDAPLSVYQSDRDTLRKAKMLLDEQIANM
jgi:hypothetical protein